MIIVNPTDTWQDTWFWWLNSEPIYHTMVVSVEMRASGQRFSYRRRWRA